MLIDPAALLLCNLLVALAVLGVVWVSQLRMPEVRPAVRLWVLGDLAHASSYLVRLLVPGVATYAGVAVLTPELARLLHGCATMLACVLHLLALLRLFDLRARHMPRWGWPALVGAPALFVLVSLLAPGPAQDGLLVPLFGAAGAVVTLVFMRGKLVNHLGVRLIALTLVAVVALVVVGLGLKLLGIDTPALEAEVTPGLSRHLPHVPELLIQLATSLGLSMGFMLTLQERLRRQLEELSTTDTLTGVFNRRGFLQHVERELAQAQRRGGHLSLAMLDLDRFKQVNDRLGHSVGDQVLIAFAEQLSQAMRRADVLARWGGEEFVLLMPATPIDAAAQAVDRFRAEIEVAPMAPGLPLVTVSAGVCELSSLPVGAGLDELMLMADEQLYKAKLRRNCVAAYHH